MSLGALVPTQVEEVFHGVTVVDPYRWLEDRGSIQTEHWIASQQRRLDVYFSSVPHLKPLRTRVSDFLNVDITDQVTQVGSLCFYRRRAKSQQQACIWVKDEAAACERLLVDPNEQGQFFSAKINTISNDGSLLAYELRYGGEDKTAIHIVDVTSGRTLPEHLATGYCRGLAFSSDNTAFYYCHEESPIGDHTIKLCRFGSSQQDRIIFHRSRTPRSKLVLMFDEFHLGAAYVHDQGSALTVDFYLARHTHDPQWECVFAHRALPCAPFLTHGRILMLTEEGAPNSRVVEISKSGVPSGVIVPEVESPIQQLSVTRDCIYVNYLIGGKTVVRVYSLTGECLGRMNLPCNGSLRFLPSHGLCSNSFFYSYESFTEPQSIRKYCPETGESEVWSKKPASSLDVPYRVQLRSYPSTDGTEISITLLTAKDCAPSAERPAILTSYGGFGVSMTPQFSVLVSILVELGVVFAVPSIRGGSERSKAWHEAARRRNRQVAIDDFIRAAEWLCTEHITGPDKLAIFGGSNSGLLVGAALTQRPDLFRAALCIAPLLDMVRYEQFGRARKWETEYGTVADAADFHALYAYSPYHHVDADRNYPSILFVTGDKDDRCDPAHVRKMAARLQDRAAQTNPILVDYSPQRGHCPVLPLSVRTEALTWRLGFLCHELNIPLPSGGPCEATRG
jgi:prolyl oligopeptidase